MNDLSDLYAEVVMDHNRRPRNFKKIEHPDRSAEGFNPLCGDQISVYLTMNGDGYHRRHWFRRGRMRNLKGRCVDDERGSQGQKFRRREKGD